MAVQSTLRDASQVYAKHRPVIQRILKAAFIAYCLGNTYSNFVRPKGSEDSNAGRRRGKSKAGDKPGEKKERVKVSVALIGDDELAHDVINLDRSMLCFTPA